MRKKINIFAFALSIIVFIVSYLYYSYFSESLNEYEWESVKGFARIIIPDTFVYLKIIDYSDFINSILLAGLKNSFGPSYIWYITKGEWVKVLFINSFIIFIGLIYFSKISEIYNIPKLKKYLLLVLLALQPATIYYSIGALKEIPSLTLLLGFFYHYLKKERVRWVFYLFMSFIFRYQIGVAILLFVFVDLFKESSFYVTIISLLMVSIFFPFIKSIYIFSNNDTESYRACYGTQDSFGGVIESVRDTMPIISAFAVFIRVIQDIFEPFFYFIRDQSFSENGDISVILIVNYVSSLLTLYFWLIFFYNTIILIKNNVNPVINNLRLFTLSLIAIIPVAGFSFIHHRYLYPFIGLILLAGSISVNNKHISENIDEYILKS